MTDPWRTRHLRLRANYLKEKLKNQPDEWKIRHHKGSTLVADLLTNPTTQVAAWCRFWKSRSFLASPRHEENAIDGKGATYQTVDGVPNLDDDTGNHVCGEVSVSPVVDGGFHETKLKIAKVGLLLGLVEKIPWNPEQYNVKTVLMVVLTLLLNFFRSSVEEKR